MHAYTIVLRNGYCFTVTADSVKFDHDFLVFSKGDEHVASFSECDVVLYGTAEMMECRDKSNK